MIIGGFEAPIIKSERLARSILKVEFAVVMGAEVLVSEPLRSFGIETAIKKMPGIGKIHGARWSAGPPSRTKRRSQ